jgi:four helix bundle protein
MYSKLAEILKGRTKQLALDTLLMLDGIPSSAVSSVLIKQLAKCSTSIGANYRSALRGKSKADFISKISIVIEEADETLYWLELLHETKKLNNTEFEKLHKETLEILSIMSKTKNSTLKNLEQS